MSIEITHSGSLKIDRAIERISTACGELQTSGLDFATICPHVMALMDTLSKVQQLRKDLLVKEKSGRGRRPGEVEGTNDEVLTPDELSRLEMEAASTGFALPNDAGEQSNVTS